MKIYIAGKITGLDHEEAANKFIFAETLLKQHGHMPLNPMKLVDQSKGRDYFEYLLDALRIMLIDSDAVYVLDNFEDSKGATAECFLATVYGRPIFYADEQLPVAEVLATN